MTETSDEWDSQTSQLTRAMGELLALAAAGLFAVGSLFGRIGSERLPAQVGLALSIIASGIVTIGWVLVSLASGRALAFSAIGALYFAAGGLAATLLGRSAAIRAVHRLGPSRASVYKNCQPIVTTLLAVTLLNERITLLSAAGGTVIVAGIIGTIRERADDTWESRAWGVRAQDRKPGITLGLLSATGFAVGNVLRKVAIDHWPEPVVGAAISVCTAGLVLFLVSGARLRRTTWSRGDATAAGMFLLLGTCSGLAQVALLASLQYTRVWVANLFVSTEPLVTVFLSWMMFRGREHLPVRLLVCLALVAAGAWMLITG